MTSPAVRVPYTPNQTAAIVFTASVLLLMITCPASRDWMAGKGSDLIVYALSALGFDLTPLT